MTSIFFNFLLQNGIFWPILPPFPYFFVYLHHISTVFYSSTNMKKQVFTVEGMKCVQCEAKVEAALKALEGVKEVKADHDADNVTIEYDEASVQPEQMKEAVDDLGRFEMIL